MSLSYYKWLLLFLVDIKVDVLGYASLNHAMQANYTNSSPS